MTQEVIISTATLIAIADPLGALTVYLGMRPKQSSRRHFADAGRVAFTVGLCLFVAAVAGTMILRAFSVELAGLTTAGGILLVTMAYYMVQGERPEAKYAGNKDNPEESYRDEKASLYMPFSIPFIAGPGAIATCIAFASKPGVELGGTLQAIGVLTLLVFFTLWFAGFWSRLLGDFGIRLMTRLLGLLVMAVGIQMTVAGVKELWS